MKKIKDTYSEIGEYRDRATIEVPGAVTAGTYGQPVEAVPTTYDVWCKAEQRGGGLGTEYDKRTWTYDLRVEKRFYKTKKVNVDETVIVRGLRYQVKEIQYKTFGQRDVEILRCSATGVTL